MKLKNNKKMKILGITCIRSEYYLMQELYKKLNTDKDVELKILVGGTHLSPTYGMTVREIESDGLDILIKIESLIDSDSSGSRLKSASILLQNSIDIVQTYSPDLIIFSADREDTIVASLLGLYLEIPTMHFFAGDHVGDGHADNPIRHASSKLCTVQMASLEEHKKRLLKMGEAKERVFHVGSVALDRFVKHRPMSKKELFSKLGIKNFNQKFALVIFHPVVEEKEYADEIFENILNALLENGISAFVGYPNTDPGNKKIIKVIEKYKKHSSFHFYTNLDNHEFLSVYKNAAFIIGNSSSGLLEAASIPIPCINVGIRGTGRFSSKNVIRTNSTYNKINGAIKKVTSNQFLKAIKGMKNPYGEGNSVDKAYKIIKNTDFKRLLYKKEDPLMS